MLIINRDPHKSRYTCISNAAVNDKRLSLAARGFLAVLLSLSDDWNFTIRGIAELTGVSKCAVQNYIAELKENGYLAVSKVKGANNCSRNLYALQETPCTENLRPENLRPENLPQINNKITNNKITNNKITNNKERGKEDITTDTREEKNCDIPPSLQTFADNSVLSCDQQKEAPYTVNEAELPQLSCDQQKEDTSPENEAELPQLILTAASQGRPRLASATHEDITAAQRACAALGIRDDSIFLDRLEDYIRRRKQLTELKHRHERS